MSYPFEKVHHICLVVRDIDEKVKYYESIGIGPWQDYPPLTQYTEVEAPNLEGYYSLKYKFVQIGDFQLQMCQPNEIDSPQKKFLEVHGEGVFHVGFVVDNVNDGEKAAKEKGLKNLSRGRRPDQTGFNYFDSEEEAGVVLLIRQSPQAK